MTKCKRCGEEGQDRRTLRIGCLYDLNELTIPFSPRTKDRLFELTICKGCRAELMHDLQVWFHTPRSPQMDENGIETLMQAPLRSIRNKLSGE